MGNFELIENLPFDLETVERPRIGLVVLASDYTVEQEFRSIFHAADCDLFNARINNAPNITPQTLAAMEPSITETAERLLPGDTLDVLAYGCTSASMVLGPSRINSLLSAAKPEAKVTNPVTAAFAAFDALRAKRVAVLTPYRSDVNKIVHTGIEAGGYEVPVFGSFNEELDPVVARIDTASLKNAVKKLVSSKEIDTVFVSCTTVRLAHCIAEIEDEIGLPVTSSNHAMAWHCSQLAGLKVANNNLGKLFNLSL